MRFLTAMTFFIAVFNFGAPLLAQQTSREENLKTCLSGKYRALCRHDWLTPAQSARVRQAELRENLATCLSGRYPALCIHAELNPDEKLRVDKAERAENLSTCLTGRYPVLCRYDLLSTEEEVQVRSSEKKENLRTCLAGTYPALCKHNQLTPEEAARVSAAEKQAPRKAAPKPTVTAGSKSGGCFESSIVKPTPFMGNNGEIFKLADGSVWEVKYEYEYLYEYYPSVVVCPARAIVILRGKKLNIAAVGETASAGQSEKSGGDVIESRIDGDFQGWTGETIFKLQNGQIWQQASYAYRYHYAYSPEVLIYRSGSSYKMQVDDIDETITVKRLK